MGFLRGPRHGRDLFSVMKGAQRGFEPKIQGKQSRQGVYGTARDTNPQREGQRAPPVQAYDSREGGGPNRVDPTCPYS